VAEDYPCDKTGRFLLLGSATKPDPIPALISRAFPWKQAPNVKLDPTTKKPLPLETKFLPLFRRTIREIDLLRTYYVPLMSAEVQKKVFRPGTFQGRTEIAVKSDGSPSIAEALKAREALWIKYIQGQTTVKESVTDDGNVFNFEVSLELNNFCAFGRAVGDLTAQ
jgi:hypothetical protein